ncbi:hypothetical protein Glove_319g168 [Diversispora epigaea]|uniref:AAA+ ATPase domain-containing protein n=1 Tax=Diversispora epigaea TaxID=1348612 RepID=A0A397HPC3_9GLOM|nr:hypothetical protein Glove_319g168 [Diversispora epigaea]
MFFFKTKQVFHQVLYFQSLSLVLRNSKPNLFQLSFLRNFTIVKGAETKYKSEAVISESYKISEKKPITSFKKKTNTSFILPGKDIPFIILYFLEMGILIDVSFALFLSQVSKYRINSALENGTRPKSKVKNDEFVLRPQISATLNRIFQPDKNHSYYNAICGEHGSGKTTLITKEATNVGKGVIYVDIPSNLENLGKAFGKAVNLSFFEETSITVILISKILSKLGLANDKTVISSFQWESVMKRFRHACEVYKTKHGKPPVIIYDNINRLVEKNPELLDILQDEAKDNADERTYVAVFVSSENLVSRRMKSRSACSRLWTTIDIGDLTKEESLDYLINKHKIDIKEAEKLYDLIGGRILQLKSEADKLQQGKPFEAIKEKIFTKIKCDFKNAKLHPKQVYHEVGKNFINALLNSKEISYFTFVDFFNTSEVANEVLNKNIFAFHPEKNTITFQSRSSEADKLQQGKPFEAIKEKIFTKIKCDFKNAKLHPKQVYHENVIFKRMLIYF